MTQATDAAAAANSTRRLEDLFPGPNPFSEKQGELFFGRDREKSELRSLLQAYRTVLLHAQSGAGKTSLVRAGLLPELDGEGIAWTRCRVAAPTSDLSGSRNVFVAGVLFSGLGPEAARRGTLLEAFDFLDSETEHVVVFDQFEEFFTYYPDRWEDREPFFEQISDVLEAKKRLRMLFVIREEFVSRLEPFAHHMPEEFQIRLFLERLRAEQAKLAVRGPFQTAGVEFESEELLDSFIDSLRRQLITSGGAKGKVHEYRGEFVEPVQLQVVCHSLAKGISPAASRITKADIDAHGNPDRSLMQFYEDALKTVARDCRVGHAKLRNWFEEGMITQGGTRGTVFMGEADTDGLPNRVVQALEATHIIRSDQRAGAVWCEITHDLLVAPIQESNRRWKTQRKALTFLAAFCGVIILLVAAGIVEWIRLRDIDAVKQTTTDNLTKAAKVAEIKATSAQSTIREFSERAVIVEGTDANIRKIQKTVADLLADFSVDGVTAHDSAIKTLTSGLKQVWAQDCDQTVRSIDRGLKLYPAMKDDLTWPAATDDVRECRRSLLSNVTLAQWNQAGFRDYIRTHNGAIVISTAEADKSAYELTFWQKKFPHAILSPTLVAAPTAPKPPGSKLVVIDYFIGCDDALDLIKKLNAIDAYKKRGPYVVSYYSDCPYCGYYRGYYMFESPGHQAAAAK